MRKVLTMVLLAGLLAGQQALAAGADKAKVTREKAQASALKKVPGKVLNWSLEKEDDGLMYSFDIQGKNGRISEVEVNAKTGKVDEVNIEIEQHKIRRTKNAGDLAKLKGVKISSSEAQKKALAKYSGDLIGWEAEIEDGKVSYEFLISGKKGKKVVSVSAKTGTVEEMNTYVDGNEF